VSVESDSFGDAVQAVGGSGGEVYSMYSTFHCTICGKGVPSQEALRDHELTHLPGGIHIIKIICVYMYVYIYMYVCICGWGKPDQNDLDTIFCI
jgi:hypothetical protein